MNIKSVILKEAFTLEQGGRIEHVAVAYSTYGHLNTDKSNAILVCHALTASSEVHEWWNGLFGPGKALDPATNFIICINNLGSPYGTSSPKSLDPHGNRYGLNFPKYTIRDNASLHMKLLDKLGINHLKMIIGGSCGGNIGLEIAYSMGNKVEELIMMCSSAYETPWVIAIHESQRIVLSSDEKFAQNSNDAAQLGLKGARAFALPFYRSHPAFKIRQAENDHDKLSDFKAASYVRYQGDKFVSRYDAHCYYMQLNALDTHNIGRGRGNHEKALNSIAARSLCIGFSTDLLIPTTEQKQLAQYIPIADYLEIDTPYGHDAFLIESEILDRAIKTWRR